MRILLRFSAAFAAGAALMLWLELPEVLSLVLLIPALLLHRRKGACILLLGVGVGIAWTGGYQSLVAHPALELAGQTVEITGTATDYSVPTDYGIRVPAELCGGTAQAVVWLSSDQPLKPGDQFTVTASLRAAERYDQAEGIFLLAYGVGVPEYVQAEHVPPEALPRAVAHRLEESLRNAVPEDVLGYAMALTTGNREQISSLEREDLKRSGLYHLLALSGIHMTVLVGTLSGVCRGKRRRALVGIPLCVTFALVTGASPSVVRAAVMESMVLLAPLLGREQDSPTALGAALLLLTAHNPYCLFNWGMQLSFASMVGLMLLGGRVYGAMDRRIPAGPQGVRLLRRFALSSLAASAGALACTVPLMMLHFRMLSLAAPVAGLLAGWAVPWCFRGSLLTALVGLAFPEAAQALGWVLAWGFRYVQTIAALLGRLPFAALSTERMYGPVWVGLVYAVALLTVRTPRGDRRLAVPCCCAAVGLVFCLLFTMLPGRGLRMTMLDVGQGQCLIFSSGGHTVMVDCGGSYDELCGDMAAAELSAMGETRLDALILTHYDWDHTSGVGELLSRTGVSQVFLPEMESGEMEELTAEVEAAGASVCRVETRTSLTLGEGTVQIFPPNSGIDRNNGLSLLVSCGEVQVLVTGDMDEDGERELLRTQEIPAVDVLVAGHHGSRYSTGTELLERAKPSVVLISVGQNSYGHPSGEALERICRSGAAVYRSDRNGTLRLKGA